MHNHFKCLYFSKYLCQIRKIIDLIFRIILFELKICLIDLNWHLKTAQQNIQVIFIISFFPLEYCYKLSMNTIEVMLVIIRQKICVIIIT
jgi:hypothetical protein